MNEQSIEEKIGELLSKSKEKATEFTRDQIEGKTFRELGFSSLEIVQLLVDTEEEFDIEINEKMESVDDLVHYIAKMGGTLR